MDREAWQAKIKLQGNTLSIVNIPLLGLPWMWLLMHLNFLHTSIAHMIDFPGGLVAKNSPDNSGDMGSILWSGKIPWRRKWQATPIFLPGKSHGQRTLVGCSSWVHKESDMTETWLSDFTFCHYLSREEIFFTGDFQFKKREGTGNLLINSFNHLRRHITVSEDNK